MVVIGAGKLGHLVARTLATTSCDLLVIGRSLRTLDLLSSRGLPTGTAGALAEREADVVVECTGNLVVDEITLVGSRCGPFAPALELLSSGAVDPRPLFDARYPLSDAVAAFEHAAKPGTLKILVDC